MDCEILRNQMAEGQLAGRGIKNKLVLEAMRKVERHQFVPENLKDNAYSDFPIPIEKNQTISQPYIVALMTECLNPQSRERILEIGTGSGYQTAILAELAQEVYSIERFPELSKKAQGLLSRLGYANIKIKIGDGSLGWPEYAPFDKIIVAAASPQVPPPLVEQLKEGGVIVLPIGEGLSQTLTVAKKKNGKLENTDICACVFVPLVGKHGQEEH